MKYPQPLALVVLFFSIAIISAYSQPVRLRSQINPNCGVSSNLKFADIYGDGNIAVQGSYQCRGAFIYDLTNPDVPVLASWYNPAPNQAFLEAIVIGNRGYFGSGGPTPSGTASTGEGVHIVDLTNPYSPILLGKVNSTKGNGFNGIHEMVVFDQGGQRYLIENFNSFSTKVIKIINITDPVNPLLVREFNPTESTWVHAIHVRGNRMFTSGWGNSVTRGRTEIYDISNLATQAPTLLGFVEDPSANPAAGNNMHSSWTSEDGNYLYSARETSDGAGDLRVYDIHNSAQPLLVNSLTMQGLGIDAVTPHNPVVMGNYLYVSWYQAGVQVFDISNPASPTRVGQYDTFPATFARSADKKRALLSEEPWDMVCGSLRLQNELPTTFDGAWAVYPFIGQNKILVGDLSTGLYVLDATGVSGPAKNRVTDFDGDRKTDFAVFSPSSGVWKTESSGDNTLAEFPWGVAGDVLVSGDYDGDDRSDLAVWRPANARWYLKTSTDGYRLVDFGANGDVPVPADFDADGKTDIAVWRPSNGTWYILQSSLGYRIQSWGENGDKPVTGDYDGDGKADMAVWRPSNGNWYIIPSATSALTIVSWGQNGDKPLLTDFDGDGRAEYTVYRPSNNRWYVLNPANGGIRLHDFGVAGDIPIPADYDGDGKTDVSVFRPSTNTWFRLNSSDTGFIARPFGDTGDIPVASAVQPQ
jgi:hypothetical protein